MEFNEHSAVAQPQTQAQPLAHLAPERCFPARLLALYVRPSSDDIAVEIRAVPHGKELCVPEFHKHRNDQLLRPSNACADGLHRVLVKSSCGHSIQCSQDSSALGSRAVAPAIGTDEAFAWTTTSAWAQCLRSTHSVSPPAAAFAERCKGQE